MTVPCLFSPSGEHEVALEVEYDAEPPNQFYRDNVELIEIVAGCPATPDRDAAKRLGSRTCVGFATYLQTALEDGTPWSEFWKLHLVDLTNKFASTVWEGLLKRTVHMKKLAAIASGIGRPKYRGRR